MRKAIATALLVLAVPAAHACGVCIEDKIAAVYDHAVVTHAVAQKRHVLFFVLEGPLKGNAVEKAVIEQIAASVPGVESGSARASSELGSLAVAYDPARTRFSAIERALQMKLRKRGLQLALLREINSADMKRAL
jgi:hypothetical protein